MKRKHRFFRHTAALTGGDLRLFDNVVPTLGAGDYLINFTQQFNPTVQSGTPIDESFSVSQVFSVNAPRYSLPGGDLFSIFPPDNGIGIFDQHLPHVVLTKPDLPWERNIFEDINPATQTPWLALISFVDGEKLGGSANTSLLDPLVPNWIPNRNKTASVSASTLQGFSSNPDSNGILYPALPTEWYESPAMLARTLVTIIDIDPTAFTLLIPPQTALPYLAHARQVDLSSKDIGVLQITGDGWYSVIVGSRLGSPPTATQPGQRTIVHLVSLEGFQSLIGENAITLPDGTQRVRMISLQNWSYTCLPDGGESFAELAINLIQEADGTPKSTVFALPVTFSPTSSEESYTYNAIQSGYVPLKYQTRLGEQTFAWYRGALTPVPIQNFISALQQDPNNPDDFITFDSASAAAIYDKQYGVFDLSYATAFETGRLLALADTQFGRQLSDWRRKGHQLVDMILERKNQIAALQNFDPENPDPATEQALLSTIQPYALTDSFVAYLLSEFATELTSPPPDVPSAPPLPEYPAFPDMPTPPTNPTTIADLMQETDVQEAIRAAGGQELTDIANWLAQRYLLIGVPFVNLVPLADLLPPESVRFFYLDSNWSDALIEGALSIGMTSSRDRLYQDLMKDLIWNTVFETVQALRGQLLADYAVEVPAGSNIPFDQESITGLLLRSSMVSGYLGLEIDGYLNAITNTNNEIEPDVSSYIKPLRVESLSSDVMLVLWAAIPAVVTLGEPHEGIAFGFEDPPPPAQGDIVYLRSINSQESDPPYGGLLCDDDSNCSDLIDMGKESLIDPTTGIVQITPLVESIASKLQVQTLTVRDFALQMIKVPEQLVFSSSIQKVTPTRSDADV